MQFVGADQLRTILARNLEVFRACAALSAQADLEDTADMGHFGSTTDRAGQPFPDPVHVVAPVKVRIDMDDGDRLLEAVVGA
ncbi:hypothetical protein D3C87_1722310 [compost metagenome]